MNKKVLVVDLDGTLYNRNTFHEFLFFLVKYFFIRGAIFQLLSLIIVIMQRLFWLISHAKMKYRVLLIIRNLKIDYTNFISKLEKHKNQLIEVSDSSFDIKILATAAPSCYAKIISKSHGFDHCLATDFPKNGFHPKFENLGDEKKKNLQNYIESHGIKTIDVFITDHIDDAPIVKLATKSVIISPNPEFLSWLNKNLINFEVRKP